MKICVIGGDGFCGWPTALHLSNKGHDVVIVDNLSRRKIDIELEVESLTPIAPMSVRLAAWEEVSGRKIRFENIDVARNYARLLYLFEEYKPDAIVHFAEQRAAPYSMKSSWHKRYTVRNNLLFNNRGQSGYGLGIKDVDNAVVEGNYFVANRVGIYNDHSPLAPGATTRTEDNLFAYNDIALWMLPLVEHNTIAGNVFQENGEQVALAGEGVLHNNSWSEAGRGNYWSDYAGYDANGDAVGDVPYVAQSLYEDLLAKNPELRLFQLSPATDAIDLAARAFPLFQPRPKMADEHPLMAPPALPTVPGLAPPPLAANLAVAAGMLLLAGLLLVLGTRRSWRNGI